MQTRDIAGYAARLKSVLIVSGLALMATIALHHYGHLLLPPRPTPKLQAQAQTVPSTDVLGVMSAQIAAAVKPSIGEVNGHVSTTVQAAEQRIVAALGNKIDAIKSASEAAPAPTATPSVTPSPEPRPTRQRARPQPKAVAETAVQPAMVAAQQPGPLAPNGPTDSPSNPPEKPLPARVRDLPDWRQRVLHPES